MLLGWGELKCEIQPLICAVLLSPACLDIYKTVKTNTYYAMQMYTIILYVVLWHYKEDKTTVNGKIKKKMTIRESYLDCNR